MITHFLDRKLDPFQCDAINALEKGDSVLVAAPTGTGKTLIADFLVDQMMKVGKTVVFTAPIKALSNQKFRDYTKLFGAENVGLITGDLVVNQEGQILIMTTEILRNVLLQSHSAFKPHNNRNDSEFTPTSSITHIERIDRIENLGAVIIDEIHFLGDPYRGTVWEELLIYLPNTTQILGLSATLSNLESFANWLSVIRGTEVKVVRENHRAVPLKYFIVNKNTGILTPKAFNKRFINWALTSDETNVFEEKKSTSSRRISNRSKSNSTNRTNPHQQKERTTYGNDKIKTTHVDVIAALDSKAFPALYFIYSRKLTETMARALAKSPTGKGLKNRTNVKEIKRRIELFSKENPGVMNQFQKMNFHAGIAYHHAGVHVALKAFIEQLYEDRLINVLYCTSTFALGVNMPARTVIFDALTRFDGTGIVPLIPREFMQMAGRAGRRGIDPFGQVVIRMDFQEWETNRPILEHIMHGDLDPIRSSFNLSFNSVLNLLSQFDEESIRQILSLSFRSFELDEAVVRLEKELNTNEIQLSRRRRAAKKRELAEAKRPILWEQFERKVDFLKKYQYISENNELYASGKVCIRIQFSEIFLTELYMQGLFEGLSANKVFGVLTGLVQTLPRNAKVSPSSDPKWIDLFDRVRKIYNSKIIQESSMMFSEPVDLCIDIMPLGEMWAQGYSLNEILGEVHYYSDLSGDIVGAFRRAKDLLGQLREIMYEDPFVRHEFAELLRSISRDEVEAVG